MEKQAYGTLYIYRATEGEQHSRRTIRPPEQKHHNRNSA